MKTLVLCLCAGLLLGFAASLDGGQLRPQATVEAPEHEQSSQLGATPDIPVDALDRGTPRRAVEGFLQTARAHDYQRAADYLDLQRFPAGEATILGPTLARHLKIVLD